MTERKDQINRCLDEIEAAFRIIKRRKTDDETKSNCNGWIRKQKKLLKELKYKGKVPRVTDV